MRPTFKVLCRNHRPASKSTFPSPSQRSAGRGPGSGAVHQKLHLTPALSPNFVGGEGDSIAAKVDARMFSTKHVQNSRLRQAHTWRAIILDLEPGTWNL